MILTEEDRNSPLWLKLKTEWENELLKLRARNDDPSGKLSDLETARIRGGIAMIKRNLDMGEVKTKIEVE